MQAKIETLSRGMGGDLLVTLSMPPNYIDEVAKLKDEVLDVELKKHRERRSTNANNYSWLLISKISEKMFPPMNKNEVYLEMLKRYGQGTTISVLTERLPDVQRELDYWEQIGTGKVNGKDFTHLRMWVGSTKYSSSEMSIFTSGIVEEAKELNIETLTPDELRKMVGEWNT